MADLFLDIRYRMVDALVSEGGEIRFEASYNLNDGTTSQDAEEDEAVSSQATWREGELAELCRRIASESGITVDQVHLIMTAAEIRQSTQKLPRLPHDEALKMVSRKFGADSQDETPPLAITPMAADQKSQSWLVEHIPADVLRAYRKEFSAAGAKLRTVTSALTITMAAVAPIREAIFNAHAIFEITRQQLNACYISSTGLMHAESLPVNASGDAQNRDESDRSQKHHVFEIINLIYRINSKYLSANAMTPLQKVWICGSEAASEEMVAAVQDAMDVEAAILGDLPGTGDTATFALRTFMRAHQEGTISNFMTADLLRRFPLRKKSGLLIYLSTALLAFLVVANAEIKHNRLKKEASGKKKELAALKSSQASTAAFAKNLEGLKQLTGRQVIFYPILRELAMRLPDQAYLENLEYSRKDNHDVLAITASFAHSDDLGNQRTLSKIMGEVSQSPYLMHHSDPSVTMSNQDKKKVVLVTFTCEVAPVDPAK